MVFRAEFDEIAPNKSAEELSSRENKQLINRIDKKPSFGLDPYCIQELLEDLRKPLYIADPDARVLHLPKCFFERLERIGYW